MLPAEGKDPDGSGTCMETEPEGAVNCLGAGAGVEEAEGTRHDPTLLTRTTSG